MERATVYAQTHYCKTVLNSAKELTAELLTSELRRGNHIKSPEIVKQFTSKVVLGGLSGASINKITLTYDPPDVGPPTLILKVMTSIPEPTELSNFILPIYNVMCVRWLVCLLTNCFCCCNRVTSKEMKEHFVAYEMLVRYEPVLYARGKAEIEKKAPKMTIPEIYSVGLHDEGDTKYHSCAFCCCRKIGKTKAHIMMEDLSSYKTAAETLVSINNDGTLSRPGEKYGCSLYDVTTYAQKSDFQENQKPDISLAEMSLASISALANMHAAFWNKKEALEKIGLSHEALPPIFTGMHYFQRGKYRNTVIGTKNEWFGKKIPKGTFCSKYLKSPVFHDQRIYQSLNIPSNYFDPWKAQWVLNFLHACNLNYDNIRLRVENLNYKETLVHHDFHNGNIMYKRNEKTGGLDIKVIDWQFCGAGAAVTDVAYVFSHFHHVIPARMSMLNKSLLHIIEEGKKCKEGPTFDTSFEDSLIEKYHQELVAGGVNDYALEDLQKDITCIWLFHLNHPFSHIHQIITGYKQEKRDNIVGMILHTEGGLEKWKQEQKANREKIGMSDKYLDLCINHTLETERNSWLYYMLVLKTWAYRYGLVNKNVTYSAI